MPSVPQLHHELGRALEAMARLPLHDVLEQRGVLRALARELALEGLRQEARFSSDEVGEMGAQLWAGLPGDAPTVPETDLAGDWIGSLPEDVRGRVRQRWDHLRLQKVLEDRYGERVEAHYLERRADLEQVVLRLMRLPQQGLAEELYLRLIDDGASFGALASRHSLGDESVTRGIVGPIELSQLHPTLRGVLASLAPGDMHPPFVLEASILLVRLEHRRPASLSEALRHRLLEELLQPDLESWLESALAELRRTHAAAPLPPAPLPALAGA
ncbi:MULTISPECIES: peptidyl-prolyl cis-trans isomerase [unclassified Synechococcus]|uniref:peptidylprolyl isomerase n=1 Tax=unclassified Synechococcus TaxID=2626047 RepID=UPI001C217581|nr:MULTISPECIES: peptidyl-prolyl cis-trans isomerase [unclassified Synechococcus]